MDKKNTDIPKGLKKEAAEFYRQTLADYELNRTGLKLLEVACFTLQRWREAKDELDAAGITVAGNIPRVHPAVKVEADARLAFCRMVRELSISEGLPNE